jgi:DNA-binding NtrC family response regulator
MTRPTLAAHRNAKILVVEDEPRFREFLTRTLSDWGLSPDAARSGEEALRSADSTDYDIALIDLNLPGINGMEFFEKLRQRTADTQVIILTAFGDLETAREAIRLDVVDFLTKPCHLGELEQAIDRAARRRTTPEGDRAPSVEPEQRPPPAMDAPRTLADIEREHILSALRRNAGNRTATATELGISRRTLHYRLNEYGEQSAPPPPDA